MASKQTIQELVRKRNEAIQTVIKTTEAIGRAICRALRPHIPDIAFRLGWWDTGQEVICLYRRKKGKKQNLLNIVDLEDLLIIDDDFLSEYTSLDGIISDVFKEAGLDIDIDNINGIYVKKSEEQAIREAIRGLIGEEK